MSADKTPKIVSFLIDKLLLSLVLLMNSWRCHYCGKRGCSPKDYPDGATEWQCYRCKKNYWENSEHEFVKGDGDVRTANASLIAAAPDIHEALVTVLQAYRADAATRDKTFEHICKAAENALLKARGEE